MKMELLDLVYIIFSGHQQAYHKCQETNEV